MNKADAKKNIWNTEEVLEIYRDGFVDAIKSLIAGIQSARRDILAEGHEPMQLSLEEVISLLDNWETHVDEFIKKNMENIFE